MLKILKKTDTYSAASKKYGKYAGCGDAVVTQVFAEFNALRDAQQVPPLACETKANTIATAWSQEMCRCDSKNAYEFIRSPMALAFTVERKHIV